MSEPSPQALIRPMQARDPQEQHRAATPLELFFDLCFVVAVSLAAGHLHHAIAEGEIGHGLLIVAELAVPVWADPQLELTFHLGHVGERYGLFTLIVLGESVLAATTALSTAMDAGTSIGPMLSLAAAGLVIVFSMWWLYFG